MPVKPALVFIFSIITACLSIFNIYAKAIASAKTAFESNKNLPLLMLDYSFWFWTIVAWISAYLIIKNYLTLSRNFNK